MSDKSSIEWTDATWNPIAGCSIVSPACTNCYAMAMAARIEAMNAGARQGGSRMREGRLQEVPLTHYAGLTHPSKAGPVWTGKIAQAPDHTLTAPLRWKKPRRIFVNSMSDLFHESVSDEWIDRIFAVMALAPQHTFQCLTKRSARMRKYMSGDRTGRIARACVDLWLARKVVLDDATWPVTSIGDIDFPSDIELRAWPLPNVWLGVTAEDQPRADERIPDLLATPAAKRFVSCEPMLGPVDLQKYLERCHADRDGDCCAERCPQIRDHEPEKTGRHCPIDTWPDDDDDLSPILDWVIAGGESGPNARPMHPAWARGLRDQCAAAGVPFFFKQWGEWLPVSQHLPGSGKIHGATGVEPGRMKLHYAGTPKQEPKYAFADKGVKFTPMTDNRLTFRVGKRAAGGLLDGVEHKAFPA